MLLYEIKWHHLSNKCQEEIMQSLARKRIDVLKESWEDVKNPYFLETATHCTEVMMNDLIKDVIVPDAVITVIDLEEILE